MQYKEKGKDPSVLCSLLQPMVEPPGVRRPSNQCQRWRAVRRNGACGGPADEERQLKTLAARVAAVFFVMG
ncbi:hypothetical protein ES288_A04G168200v1 [Gossypium darwinii]|uniref:Uncharacterized protein n=1 Tax=Gossypium darwinii TaxID=34276 RepID=A0A5D2H097_GOSDA|nr:hypothetical protein ES288_A04G168200v1 [Gossypium darwinii]